MKPAQIHAFIFNSIERLRKFQYSNTIPTTFMFPASTEIKNSGIDKNNRDNHCDLLDSVAAEYRQFMVMLGQEIKSIAAFKSFLTQTLISNYGIDAKVLFVQTSKDIFDLDNSMPIEFFYSVMRPGDIVSFRILCQVDDVAAMVKSVPASDLLTARLQQKEPSTITCTQPSSQLLPVNESSDKLTDHTITLDTEVPKLIEETPTVLVQTKEVDESEDESSASSVEEMQIDDPIHAKEEENVTVLPKQVESIISSSSDSDTDNDEEEEVQVTEPANQIAADQQVAKSSSDEESSSSDSSDSEEEPEKPSGNELSFPSVPEQRIISSSEEESEESSDEESETEQAKTPTLVKPTSVSTKPIVETPQHVAQVERESSSSSSSSDSSSEDEASHEKREIAPSTPVSRNAHLLAPLENIKIMRKLPQWKANAEANFLNSQESPIKSLESIIGSKTMDKGELSDSSSSSSSDDETTPIAPKKANPTLAPSAAKQQKKSKSFQALSALIADAEKSIGPKGKLLSSIPRNATPNARPSVSVETPAVIVTASTTTTTTSSTSSAHHPTKKQKLNNASASNTPAPTPGLSKKQGEKEGRRKLRRKKSVMHTPLPNGDDKTAASIQAHEDLLRDIDGDDGENSQTVLETILKVM